MSGAVAEPCDFEEGVCHLIAKLTCIPTYVALSGPKEIMLYAYLAACF